MFQLSRRIVGSRSDTAVDLYMQITVELARRWIQEDLG